MPEDCTLGWVKNKILIRNIMLHNHANVKKERKNYFTVNESAPFFGAQNVTKCSYFATLINCCHLR